MRWPITLTTPLDLTGTSARRRGVIATAAWAALCALLLVLIAAADYLTGYALNLSILYLATVCLATWMLGRTAGVVFSLAAVCGWLAADRLTGHAYGHSFYLFWEVVIRGVTWLGFALLLDRLKTALANSDDRFVTVLAQLDAAVYVADGVTGELLYMNERCRAAFGSRPASVHEISDRWARTAEVPNGLPSAGGFQTEVQDTVTGRWYLIAARSIRWIDGRRVALYIATDVTGRRNAEELLRQQQERLEITARLTTLGEMASTLAHEINQPLAAIANYCRGCLRRLRGGEWQREELLDALEKAVAQAERAGGIVQRVRDFPRKRDPDLRACDINAVVEEVARMMDTESGRRGSVMRLALTPDLPPALADRIMIEQVILNLIRNGVEAMQGSPLPTREITIRSAAAVPTGIAIEVADRGCGLPPQLARELFIPYFTTKPDGMGMGLHICRSIIERHGGRLTAVPREGGGTVFRFTLPAAQRA